MTELTTTQKIINALDELQEIHGTEYLAYEVIGVSSKTWVRCQVRKLEAAGILTIIRSRGGWGRRTIYRRNRNSPGYPRRTR